MVDFAREPSMAAEQPTLNCADEEQPQLQQNLALEPPADMANEPPPNTDQERGTNSNCTLPRPPPEYAFNPGIQTEWCDKPGFWDPYAVTEVSPNRSALLSILFRFVFLLSTGQSMQLRQRFMLRDRL